MIRRYIWAAIVMLILGGLVYGYQKFKRFNTPVSSVLMAVPEGSALVIETSDALNLWEKLTHTSVVWEDLKNNPLIGKIHTIGATIDSVFQSDAILKNHFYNRKAIAAVAPSGAERYSLLFAVSTPPDWTDFKISNTLHQFLPQGTETTTRFYDDIEINTINSNNKTLFHWARKSGLLMMSTEILALEGAIRMIDAPTNLTADKDFEKIGKTAGLYAHANVYIDYNNWRGFLKTLLNQRGQQAPFFESPFAGWSALDLTVRTSEIMLNGFVQVKDSTAQYFNILKGQKGQNLEMAEILPDNTAHLVYFGLSHFDSFYQNFRKLKRDQQAEFSYNQQLEAFNHRIDGNAADYLTSWIDTEMALFITEPTHTSYDQLTYLAFGSKDNDFAIQNLGIISTALGKTPSETDISGHKIYEMSLANAYGILLGAPFENFNDVFVTSIADYILIARTKAAMRNLISFYHAGKTLQNDDHFKSFTENLSKRSNLLIYSAIARAPELYSPFLTSGGVQIIEAHMETLRNFDGFAYQLTDSGEDMFYNNIFLRHNPVYTRESGAFWELALDTGIAYGPQLVLNHYTQSREILVQDSSQTLHLISNTGQVLWSRKIEGRIIGKVQQIDLYKNDKLQLLFNTPDHLYLIDRNGNDVENYPITLSAKATAPFALFDYDNSRDYRILQACNDRQLRMYDGHGKVVKGWKSSATDEVVRYKPQHLRLGNKDYIFAADDGGKIYLLNRQGKPRHRVKQRIRGSSGNPLFFREGKNINQTEVLYTDTSGNLVALKFDETAESFRVADNRNHFFVAADLNNDQRQEFVIATTDELTIYDSEGDEICAYNVEGIHQSPVIYSQQNDHSWMGVLQDDNESIYLIDDQCQLFSDFPLFATGDFTIGDINKDGVLNIVAIGEPNTLYTYNVE